jgi:hypothetical protein
MIGDVTLHDVLASTNPGNTALLGQSFLRRFKSWSLDYSRGVLVLQQIVVSRVQLPQIAQQLPAHRLPAHRPLRATRRVPDGFDDIIK